MSFEKLLKSNERGRKNETSLHAYCVQESVAVSHQPKHVDKTTRNNSGGKEHEKNSDLTVHICNITRTILYLQQKSKKECIILFFSLLFNVKYYINAYMFNL